MPNNLKVLITGSSKGIGLETAKKFLENSYEIWITGKEESRMRNTLESFSREFPGRKVKYSILDLTEPKNLEKLFLEVKSHWGYLNCLVLNLGSGSPQGPYETRTEANSRLFKVNYQSSKDTLDRFKDLLEPKNSSVIFVSTVAVKIKSQAPKQYVMAKVKLENYAKSMALELAKKGIRCNVVRPGHTLAKAGVWEKKLSEDREGTERLIQETVPLGRLARAEEVAAAIYFLASNEASFITGAFLDVAGGLGAST